MIKELEGRYRFFQDDPIRKYFFDRKATENEIQKMDDLAIKIEEFAKKVDLDDYDFKFAGYLDNYGYYILFDEDRGWYGLMPLGEDIEEAFSNCISISLSYISHYYELKNRDELQKNFNSRFSNMGFVIKETDEYILEDYCPLFYDHEYELSVYDKYYDGNIPTEIIERYTNSLNNFWWSKEQGVKWEYDYNTKRFNCSKIKDKLQRRIFRK